uniref:Polypeptide N-acetylgalactosaminyltransferase 14 n=1 Tax=Sphaerodactylus townsendi TaxID=933632 RepID=A0ACB8GAI6_9SAUR
MSVLNRTPVHLVHEIILVDDFSDDPDDCRLLVKLPKVKCLRNRQREADKKGNQIINQSEVCTKERLNK